MTSVGWMSKDPPTGVSHYVLDTGESACFAEYSSRGIATMEQAWSLLAKHEKKCLTCQRLRGEVPRAEPKAKPSRPDPPYMPHYASAGDGIPTARVVRMPRGFPRLRLLYTETGTGKTWRSPPLDERAAKLWLVTERGRLPGFTVELGPVKEAPVEKVA